jgi:hypothetical protein
MSAIDEIARLKADKDVIRSQERNGAYERDIDALEAEIAKLTAVLGGIAEFCSADGSTLGSIERLVHIRNTAMRAIGRTRVDEQRMPQGKE